MSRIFINQGSYTKIYKEGNKAIKTIELDNKIDFFFLREIEILASISHPYIIKIHNISFVSNNLIEIVMDYHQFSLSDFKNLSIEKIKKYSFQILQAINYLHKNKIAHRDLKQNNILIDNNDNIIIIDFNMSRRTFEDKPNSPLITTFTHRAPEIFKKQTYDNYEIDMWSIGCIILGMLINKKNIFGKDENMILKNIENIKPIKNIIPEEFKNQSQLIEIIENLMFKRISCEEALTHPFFSFYFLELNNKPNNSDLNSDNINSNNINSDNINSNNLNSNNLNSDNVNSNNLNSNEINSDEMIFNKINPQEINDSYEENNYNQQIINKFINVIKQRTIQYPDLRNYVENLFFFVLSKKNYEMKQISLLIYGCINIIYKVLKVCYLKLEHYSQYDLFLIEKEILETTNFKIF